MKVEIWSDYACPFCYIGEVTGTTVDRFAKKYGLSVDDAAENIENISRMGRAEGIDFKYSSTLYTNTFDSLRVTKLAQERGHNEIITKFFDAYFTKNLVLANHDVLKKIALECGLDEKEVDDVLSSDKYADEVRADEMQAKTHT